MPDSDYDRISQKMRDFICVILVPNPAERPTIEQLLAILTNWSAVPKINLSASAAQIKRKNCDVKSVPVNNSSKPSIGGSVGDITADDFARVQQKIKEE